MKTCLENLENGNVGEFDICRELMIRGGADNTPLKRCVLYTCVVCLCVSYELNSAVVINAVVDCRRPVADYSIVPVGLRTCPWYGGRFVRPCCHLNLLWPPYRIGQAIIFLPSGFILSFYIPFFPRLISAAAHWMSLPYFDTWVLSS